MTVGIEHLGDCRPQLAGHGVVEAVGQGLGEHHGDDPRAAGAQAARLGIGAAIAEPLGLAEDAFA